MAIQFDKASHVSSLPCLIALHSTLLETHNEMQEKSIVLPVDMTFRIRSLTHHAAFHFKSDVGCSLLKFLTYYRCDPQRLGVEVTPMRFFNSCVPE